MKTPTPSLLLCLFVTAALGAACDDAKEATTDTATTATTEADATTADDDTATTATDDTATTATDDTATTATDDTATTPPAGVEVGSTKGAYTVWFDGPAMLRVGVEASYTVTVHDAADAPVTGLALAPRFTHATMGHGGLKNPTATEVGGGVYTIGSVAPSMSGDWNLDVTLPGSDKARLVVTVKP